MLYSAATNGFYDSDIHDNIPSDAVEITRGEWESLLLGQKENKQIVAGPDGKPTLIEREAAPIVELTAAQKLEALGLTVDELKALLAGK
jgi:hypothetical protein